MRRAVLALALVPALACLHDWSLPLNVDASADVDANMVDAAGAEDTGQDANFASCVGSLLCDHFDDSPLLQTWDAVVVSPGGRAATEAFPGALSPPNVLVSERPSQEDSASTAYVSKVLSQPLTRVRMQLAIAPDQLDATSFTTVAAIVFDHQGANEHKIRLALRRDAAQLQELGTTALIDSHPLPRALPIDAWSRIAMEVEAGGKIRVTVDGESVLDVAAAAGWRPSGRTLIVAGINFVLGAHQAIRVRVDDVRVDGS